MDIKISNALEHIDPGDRFLNITPVAQTPRETKWIQETSWHWKASAKQRTWPTRQYDGLHNGKRSSLTPHQTEVWSPQYTKNSRNWSSKEQRIQLTKWSTDLNRELSTEESKMADRHWENVQHPSSSEKCTSKGVSRTKETVPNVSSFLPSFLPYWFFFGWTYIYIYYLRCGPLYKAWEITEVHLPLSLGW